MRGFRIVNSFVYGDALSELTGLAVLATSLDPLAGELVDFPDLARALPHAVTSRLTRRLGTGERRPGRAAEACG